jgi:hypothetical protein
VEQPLQENPVRDWCTHGDWFGIAQKAGAGIDFPRDHVLDTWGRINATAPAVTRQCRLAQMDCSPIPETLLTGLMGQARGGIATGVDLPYANRYLATKKAKGSGSR